jgi:MGT family glycosyltransferase
MAKVLWFNIPALGHILPTLTVVDELRRRGHEVVYYCTDDTRATVEPSGVRFEAYPADVLSMQEIADANTRLVHPGPLMVRKSHRLVPFAQAEIDREAPDLVVHDQMAVWAGIAARQAGIPTVASHPMMAIAGPRVALGLRNDLRWRLSQLLSQRVKVRERSRLSAQLGIEAIRDPQFGMAADRHIVFVSPELNHGSASLDERYVPVGPTFDDRATDGADWTPPPGDGPLVLLSLGTLTKVSSRFYAEVVKAFRDHPGRFVMYGGSDVQRHPLAPFPANFTVSSTFLPQLRILEECDALICNGGMGSVQQGLHHGVPQVLIPQMIENAINARRVAELGAGVVLGDQPPYGRVKAAALRRALDQVLSDESFRRRAEELGKAGRAAGGYARAADEIERLLPQA